MIYQGRGNNTRRGCVRSRSYSYGRGIGRGCGFNSTEPEVRRKCEALGRDIYSIGDTQQEHKYTKITEAILNHSQISFNEVNNVKEVLEELNHYKFDVNNPKSPGNMPEKGSIKEMILREEVKNWFV